MRLALGDLQKPVLLPKERYEASVLAPILNMEYYKEQVWHMLAILYWQEIETS